MISKRKMKAKQLRKCCRNNGELKKVLSENQVVMTERKRNKFLDKDHEVLVLRL